MEKKNLFLVTYSSYENGGLGDDNLICESGVFDDPYTAIEHANILGEGINIEEEVNFDYDEEEDFFDSNFRKDANNLKKDFGVIEHSHTFDNGITYKVRVENVPLNSTKPNCVPFFVDVKY